MYRLALRSSRRQLGTSEGSPSRGFVSRQPQAPGPGHRIGRTIPVEVLGPAGVLPLRRVFLALLAGAWLLAAPSASSAEQPILLIDQQTAWRYQAVCRAPVARTGEGNQTELISQDNWRVQLPEGPFLLPSREWIEPDFDDSAWPAVQGAVSGGFGTERPSGLALLCLRTRFSVLDPKAVGALELSVEYRGGVVVYVNGQEVQRGHLPDGPLDPLTLATDYPRDVFVTPGGEAVLPNYGSREPPAELRQRYQNRIRRLTVSVPGEVLRRGENVLALEIHRTALPAELPEFGRGAWDTAGFCGAQLIAPAGSPVVARAASSVGPRIWEVPCWARVEKHLAEAAPFDPAHTLRLVAPRNGFDSAQIVVAQDSPLHGLRVVISDLLGLEGARIPASACRIRYAKVDEVFVPLLERPIAGATIQPVWLSVFVPADTPPGKYTGRLELEGLDKPYALPVELTVSPWLLAPARQWQTSVNLLQSPESVAGRYGVALWSDEHFRLMEPSLALMGRAGNDVLGISAVRQSVFGDDPMVVFRRVSGRCVPEMKLVRRYLALYDRHAGAPQFLALHVWNYGMYQSGSGRDGGTVEQRAETIPVMELRGAELVPIELPIYGRPGTEDLWQEVIDSLRKCLEELGWEQTRLLLGTSGDAWPSPSTVDFFRRIAPDAQWRALTHGGGVPRWGLSDHERTQPNGMIVGYLEIARRLENHRIKRPEHPVSCNARDNVGTDPFTYRGLAVVHTITTNYDGLCWKGIDYWTYTTPEGLQRNALNTYCRFGNMVGGTPRAMAWPGPQGAVTTAQFEMLLSGLQDAEAALAVREAIQRLREPPGQRYDMLNLRLAGALWREEKPRGEKAGEITDRDLDLTLVLKPGQLLPQEIIVTARTYNKGTHQCRFEPLPAPTGQKLRLHVTLGDDPWVRGGQGSYVLHYHADGQQYAGSFEGQYEGRPRRGSITGTLTAGLSAAEIAASTGRQLRLPDQDRMSSPGQDGASAAGSGPAVELPEQLVRSTEQAVEELSRMMDRGLRGGLQGKRDLDELRERLYAAAGTLTVDLLPAETSQPQ